MTTATLDLDEKKRAMRNRENAVKLTKGRNKQAGWTLLEVSATLLILSILSAMAIPQFMMFRKDTRTFGDARDLADMVLLAKMRAASNFTHARIYADTSGNSYHIETWSKTAASWVVEGVTIPLSTGNTFAFGSLSTPPTGTQSSIGLAPVCQAMAGGTGTISNTSCIVFNSRGIPIDSTGAPTANDAFYITDGSTVYAGTMSATGLFQLWRTDIGAANWVKR
jgi:prepilin-type N-terminal cleavage/methylation domain-containing protein